MLTMLELVLSGDFILITHSNTPRIRMLAITMDMQLMLFFETAAGAVQRILSINFTDGTVTNFESIAIHFSPTICGLVSLHRCL